MKKPIEKPPAPTEPKHPTGGGCAGTTCSALPSEHVLPDDYPVHWDYIYLCDGLPVRSVLGGGCTVSHLKAEVGCQEIRNCDIVARMQNAKDEGPLETPAPKGKPL